MYIEMYAESRNVSSVSVLKCNNDRNAEKALCNIS